MASIPGRPSRSGAEEPSDISRRGLTTPLARIGDSGNEHHCGDAENARRTTAELASADRRRRDGSQTLVKHAAKGLWRQNKPNPPPA